VLIMYLIAVLIRVHNPPTYLTSFGSLLLL
jgi:hypothetical protein